MNKTVSNAPFTLGLIGGIIGLLFGLCAVACAQLFAGMTMEQLAEYETELDEESLQMLRDVMNLVTPIFLVSALAALGGLVGGCLAKTTAFGSLVLLISGIVSGIVTIVLFVLMTIMAVPFAATPILFIIGGIKGMKNPVPLEEN